MKKRTNFESLNKINMKKTTSAVFKTTLNPEKEAALLLHFNTIYECNALSEHEYKIAYLAFLWKNGFVYTDTNENRFIIKEETGVDEFDYELTFEVDESGGSNLDITYDFYDFNKMMEII